MKNDLFSQGSQWIWMDSAANENCYLQFQTEFQVVGEDSLVLHLTAEGQYVVFLDGNYLPSTQYPDFPHRKSVQRIEIPRLSYPGDPGVVFRCGYLCDSPGTARFAV